MTDWRERGNCFGTYSTVFFPAVTRGSVANYVQALQICHTCPVQDQCLDDALTTNSNHHDWGVWGGTVPSQRREMRSAKVNQHG